MNSADWDLAVERFDRMEPHMPGYPALRSAMESLEDGRYAEALAWADWVLRTFPAAQLSVSCAQAIKSCLG